MKQYNLTNFSNLVEIDPFNEKSTISDNISENKIMNSQMIKVPVIENSNLSQDHQEVETKIKEEISNNVKINNTEISREATISKNDPSNLNTNIKNGSSNSEKNDPKEIFSGESKDSSNYPYIQSNKTGNLKLTNKDFLNAQEDNMKMNGMLQTKEVGSKTLEFQVYEKKDLDNQNIIPDIVNKSEKNPPGLTNSIHNAYIEDVQNSERNDLENKINDDRMSSNDILNTPMDPSSNYNDKVDRQSDSDQNSAKKIDNNLEGFDKNLIASFGHVIQNNKSTHSIYSHEDSSTVLNAYYKRSNELKELKQLYLNSDTEAKLSKII